MNTGSKVKFSHNFYWIINKMSSECFHMAGVRNPQNPFPQNGTEADADACAPRS